ncbi:hypothetical protein LWI28_010833 [Acer negundo]|uniref:Dehydrin n=1 Tax=Acer negundo TaxID=4023 RepID=A0AAD5NLJ0_ACENE|nr:hypothetical protein LWI28_010833 [Acer negundo]KAK4840542.1 hypothetical protein QYF36_011469 [Acer negundo]
MEHYNKNQRGAVNPQTDKHGNIIRQTGKAGLGETIKEQIPGMGHTDNRPHHNTGTGATNAHDGAGIGQKIKDAIPCMGHKNDKTHYPGSTTTTAHGGGGIGMKIKNAIPGMGHRVARPHHTTGTTTTPGGGGYGVSGKGQHLHNQHGQAKKGVVQKIKEKLPGYHGY